VTRSDEIPPRASEATSLFERLFAEYQTPILNYLFRLVGDPALAEDQVQEAFTRAWRARAQLIVVENPCAWLYRVALSAEGAWFFADNNLWPVPCSGAQPHLVAAGLAGGALRGEPRPAPDGQQVAFACGSDLCLMALSGGQGDGMANVQRATGLEPAEIAWSPAGSLLAVIDGSANPAVPLQLAVVGRDAKIACKSRSRRAT
jgi:Sigma-70 region 2